MHIALADIAAWMGQFFWPFERIGAAFMVAPIFGSGLVPARLRIGMAFVTTVAVMPFVGDVPAVSPFGAAGVLITAQQIMIGAAMGFILRLTFEAVSLGGQVMAMTMGLGFAYTVDHTRGLQVGMVSQYFMVMTTLLFLAMNGHLVLIRVIAGSFSSLPVGATGIGNNGIWALVSWGSHMFIGAARVALPAVVAMLIVQLAFGVISRSAPSMNLFSVGFPITMFLGLVIIWLSLKNLTPNLSLMSDGAFGLMHRLLTPGS